MSIDRPIFHAVGSHRAAPGLGEKLVMQNRSERNSSSLMIPMRVIILFLILGKGFKGNRQPVNYPARYSTFPQAILFLFLFLNDMWLLLIS